jgi:hypothetical protein
MLPPRIFLRLPQTPSDKRNENGANYSLCHCHVFSVLLIPIKTHCVQAMSKRFANVKTFTCFLFSLPLEGQPSSVAVNVPEALVEEETTSS